jgi:hypothetical protein
MANPAAPIEGSNEAHVPWLEGDTILKLNGAAFNCAVSIKIHRYCVTVGIFYFHHCRVAYRVVPANGTCTGLLQISGEFSCGIRETDPSARSGNSHHRERRHDGYDGNSNQQLHNGEAALPMKAFVAARCLEFLLNIHQFSECC